MQSHISAIRAVTVQYATDFVRPLLWWGTGILVAFLVIIGVLAVNFSAWWWILAVPVLIIGCIGLAVWLVLRLIARRISPVMTTRQKTATKAFVAKVSAVTEVTQTPYPLIMFRIVKDIITRTDKGYIHQVTQHSTQLRPDFDELRKLF